MPSCPSRLPFFLLLPYDLNQYLAMTQQPTCVGLRVRTPADAHVIFHAVHERLLRMVARRLDTEERRAISPGCVYVWEERGANAEANGAVSLLFRSSICQLRAYRLPIPSWASSDGRILFGGDPVA